MTVFNRIISNNSNYCSCHVKRLHTVLFLEHSEGNGNHMIKKVVKKQENAHDCFVCGLDNDSGLKAAYFELEDESVVGIAIAQSIHQSYTNTVHGGVITALLDETMGRAIKVFEPETWGVTVEINVTFKAPVPYDSQLIITGRITANTGKIFICEGELILADGTVAALATGTFYKMHASRLESRGADRNMMQLYVYDTDPTEIDIPIEVHSKVNA